MKRNSLRGCSPLLLTERGFQEASQMPLGSLGDSELQTARPEHKDSGIEGQLKETLKTVSSPFLNGSQD